MFFYPEGSEIRLSVSLQDLGAVTTVSAELFNEDETKIHDFASIPITDEISVEFVVPTALAVVSDGFTSEGMSVRVEITTAAGAQYRMIYFGIEKQNTLLVPNNSFMTYTAANAGARALLFATGWQTASDASRKAALAQAFHKLSRIPYQFDRDLLPHGQALELMGDYFGDAPRDKIVLRPRVWEAMSAETFRSLPAAFRTALAMAQLAEAEDMLRGEGVEAKARAGIVSETIGESSIRLNTRRLVSELASSTAQFLRGYIYYSFRIVR